MAGAHQQRWREYDLSQPPDAAHSFDAEDERGAEDAHGAEEDSDALTVEALRPTPPRRARLAHGPRFGGPPRREHRPSALGAQRTHAWRWARTLCGAVCVLAALAVLLPEARATLVAVPARLSALLPQPGAPATLPLAADGMVCPQQAAWAPRGARVAVVGFTGGCPGIRPARLASFAAQVNVYDAAGLRPIAHFSPDGAVAAALGIAASGPTLGAASHPSYHSLVWSPDGTRLALTFDVVPPAATPGALRAALGVVVLNVADAPGSAPNVLLARAPVYDPGPGRVYLWDLLQRRLITRSQGNGGETANDGLFPLAEAQVYQWKLADTAASEQLTPAQPLASGGVTPAIAQGPIGSPVSQVFSIWQPGAIRHSRTLAAARIVYTWSSSFAAWSPDGRYLADPITASTALAYIPTTVNLVGAAPTVGLAPRDAGLRRILDTLAATPDDQDTRSTGVDPDLAVAWRPDGRVVAAMRPGSTRVDLYDCASGRLLATLTPARPLSRPLTSQTLAWSPDGTRLLTFDARLFGTAQLPR